MLIALSGLSGAGKSTAIRHLERLGVGASYYAGAIVRDEIERRQLAPTPENEGIVREDLRSRFGMAVFAERAIPDLLGRCSTQTILLDSVYCLAERDCLQAHFSDRLVLIAVSASLAVRSARLAARPDRPLSYERVLSRDAFERDKLGIDDVIAAANHRVANEASLEEFKEALNVLAGSLP
jgi:dephospho-CoA kinase